MSCLFGDVPIAKLLLQCKHIDINIPAKSDGLTPLAVACDKGHYEIVELLINYDTENKENAGMFLKILLEAVDHII